MFSDVLHGTRSQVEWNDAGHLTGRGFIYYNILVNPSDSVTMRRNFQTSATARDEWQNHRH